MDSLAARKAVLDEMKAYARKASASRLKSEYAPAPVPATKPPEAPAPAPVDATAGLTDPDVLRAFGIE